MEHNLEKPTQLIGYSELRTDLPGGRFANVSTVRAKVVRADGTDRRELASSLITRPGSSTQFMSWSPDGGSAVILSAWESEENAAWEEEHKQFRQIEGGYLVDSCLVDIANGEVVNMTAIERVSYMNTGFFYWPNDPTRLGFQALINEEMHPFSMNIDGTGKTDMSRGPGYTYGFSSSPDGTRVSYHRNYYIHVADADGSNPVEIVTGNSFNFGPSWSPDGKWLLFLSGEHALCHPYVVKSDGTGLRKLADRGNHFGAILVLDVYDFHGGSSDCPVWSRDGQWVYYTAQMEDRYELMRVSLEGKIEQLTESEPGVLHYHPMPSPDGKWLMFGAKKDGMRQLYIARPDGTDAYPITEGRKGYASMWGSWQPNKNTESAN